MIKSMSNRLPIKLTRVLGRLTASEKNLVVQFALFLRARTLPDPEQQYFWTEGWQSKERDAGKDKKSGRVLGNGSVDDLISSLHQ